MFLFCKFQFYTAFNFSSYYTNHRSITRQYFRKADAVVVVYDITNEKSFLNAKNWILSAQEAVPDDSIVFLLLGNKLDRADDDVLR